VLQQKLWVETLDLNLPVAFGEALQQSEVVVDVRYRRCGQTKAAWLSAQSRMEVLHVGQQKSDLLWPARLPLPAETGG